MNELSAIQIPHGLADTAGEFAFVVGPQGLIYRLDLRSGESQARTSFPGTPLAIREGMLIGWRRAPDSSNAIQVFAVAPQGEVLSPVWEQTLTMPAWVEIDSQEPERFNLKADGRDDELVVTWEARSRYSGGAPPPPEVETAARREASKAVHMDTKTGTILREEQKELVPVTETPLPSLAAKQSIVPYLQGDAWFTQPWSVHAGEVYLVRSTGEPGVLLVRHEPGRTSPEETRLTGDPTAVATVTPDGKYVFIQETRNDPASWLVFSALSGERVAKLPFEPGTQGVSVVRDQVLYLVVQEDGQRLQRTLHSRDLPTGQVMWSFKLEDGSTQMAPPPAP